MIRRAIDIVVSALGLLVASPVLAVAIVAIRLESRGPAIYRQRRAGLDGEPFEMLKLRTMVEGAEHIGAGLAVNADDPRITRVGALLRRTSLDELPNLLNVLRGEMSLIGPRPTLPAQVAQYTERQRGRLRDPPGDHRLGAGQRPRGAALVRADRARPLLHRAPLAGARPADPVAHGRDGARRLRPVQGRRPAAGRASCEPLAVPSARDPADGRGKRYDIVSCFARADEDDRRRPSPLAPGAVRRARARAPCR